MSSLLAVAGGVTTKTTTIRSLLALALRAWSLCVFLVVIAALLLVSPAAVVILFPVACMAVSACLICAIAARILLPFFILPPGHHDRSGGVHERKQDCVEVDLAEAPPGGGFDDDDDSASSSVEEGHGEEEEGGEKEHGLCFSSSGQGFSGPCDDDERRRFFFEDRGSCYRTFYDLLAFWRSMEREASRRGGKNCPIYQVTK
ncbi:hypothetical protein HU200_001047 [Digitaria exilis]|uniref:Uncharacterized protein n=1 Tax=Digitaria exilis TaxID=1010633 RepID=A0A835KWW6_9POAL|nr:hypothetical protein HU200_001047 [Digitaria exilis]